MDAVPENILKKLQPFLQGEAAYDATTRALYATAACMYKIFPLGVIYPQSTADVAAVVRFAREKRMAVTPRGAGSGLVGQSVNRTLMLDFTRHMNRILSYDVRRETVRVQPGVIYGELNRYLKPYQRYFAPDPSSGEYITLGGMVANNAAGAHSIKNGATVDYIESLEVVLADGQIVRLQKRDLQSRELLSSLKEDTPTGRVSRFLYDLVRDNEALINKYTPHVEKNTSGYRLEKIISENRFCPANIFASSEGTLGIITEIELHVKKPPDFKILTVINFDTLEKAAQAIEPILQLGASAVEMMAKEALALVRKYRPELAGYFPASVESQLFVEFDGDDPEFVRQQNDDLQTFLKKTFPLGMDYLVAQSQNDQKELWKIRKASFPLVYNEKRPEKVLAFIEDFVVRPRDIAVYIRRLYEIYEKYRIDAIILGHAGRGNFHPRPFINLTDAADVKKIQQVMNDVFELVAELGGSLSGEHGDGRARAHLLPQLVGPLYQVYEQVKQFFDPENRMNPGVKMNRENQLTQNLRFSSRYKRHKSETLLHFEDDDYYYEVEKCHGCSACHQTNATTTMCPIYQISGDELAAPRGKANILQNLLSGDLTPTFTRSKDYKKMLDYCVYCEACFVDCSSHVDVGRLLLEHKARYRKAHGTNLLQHALEHGESLSRLNSFLAPVVNPLLKNKAVRYLMEKSIGIDRRRIMPVAESPLKFRKNRKTGTIKAPLAKVVFFTDLFARYNHSALTRQAIKILETYHVQVEVPNLKSAAMPAIVYGNLELARRTIRKNLPLLSGYVNRGFQIVSTEPTAVLAMRKEWKDILPDPQVQEIAAEVYEFFEFLLKLKAEKKIDEQIPLKSVPIRFGYHAPCHLKALQIGRPGVEILQDIPGIKINEINRGCCGIAGTYGFKKGSNGFEQSMKIGAALFDELSSADTQYGLTECSTCRMQMEQGSGKNTLHPVEVLAWALGIKKSG